MKKNKRKIFIGQIVLLSIILGWQGIASAEIKELECWPGEDPTFQQYPESVYKQTYRPYPVLFLHGLGLGNPKSWEKAIPEIEKYFTERYYVPEGLKNGYLYNKEKNPSNRYYLEIINFADPNGFIDAYSPGKTNPQGNNKGWANKVSDAVANLLASDKYGEDPNIDKVLLVAHSMGGLAGREYLRDKNV